MTWQRPTRPPSSGNGGLPVTWPEIAAAIHSGSSTGASGRANMRMLGIAPARLDQSGQSSPATERLSNPGRLLYLGRGLRASGAGISSSVVALQRTHVPGGPISMDLDTHIRESAPGSGTVMWPGPNARDALPWRPSLDANVGEGMRGQKPHAVPLQRSVTSGQHLATAVASADLLLEANREAGLSAINNHATAPGPSSPRGIGDVGTRRSPGLPGTRRRRGSVNESLVATMLQLMRHK